ncbi:tripartite tricarboxylate transporter permease [Vallitalea okinawensis]|uniref:tripartite tricarboxylate transporter permease n=1 Tax=Vallitalea okinawensis TaxID=2078660 RepID=UPI000CFDE3C3|nr:tripartite tricarboxylate transporter permease [Vallitalea okinawensis]
MIENLISGFKEFFTIGSFVFMNIGLLLGVVFGSIPGLTVMLCIVLFLPFTYSMSAVHSFMFLLGIYCAGSYGGSISAILIKTPGTPHATATMMDGYPLSQKGQSKKALDIALYASTFGGIFSALVLLFLAPQVAKAAMKIGSPEYFLICVFGLTIIAGVSGKSLLKGMIAGCLGLFVSMIGVDAISSGTMRFAFGNVYLYGGINLVIALIGLFALVEIFQSITRKSPVVSEVKMSSDNRNGNKGKFLNRKKKYRLKRKSVETDEENLSLTECKNIVRPAFISSLIGVIIGIIPGTGASMASFLSYDTARKMSKKPELFGHGSKEGIAAAESANNAVTGATLIPLLTLGIPGDGAVAVMLGALMINGLTPGPNLFNDHGTAIYAIMIGLIFVNIFMFLQGKYLTKLFAKVVLIPKEILTPIIVVFCFAGAYSIKDSLFEVGVALVFGIIAYIMSKVDYPTIPVLLGLVLGALTEKNFRRTMVISDGSWSIFTSRPISIAFIILILIVIVMLMKSNMSAGKMKSGKMKSEPIKEGMIHEEA